LSKVEQRLQWRREKVRELSIKGHTQRHAVLALISVLSAAFEAPQKYQEGLGLYIKSLNSERAGYALFRDYVETDDPQLNETSIDLLSNATKYELESFNLINTLR
jgi:hypothetical protein